MTIGDDHINWDEDALRAAKAKWPYIDVTPLLYLNDIVTKEPFDLLDLGCQIGSWHSAWKTLRPKVRYTGVDFSLYALGVAKQRYPESTFLYMNATQMDFMEQFDVVFTHAVLQHMNRESHEKLAPLIHQSLRSKGLLIIQENVTGRFYPDYWIDLFTRHGFALMRKIDSQDGGMKYVFTKTEGKP